MQRRVLFTLACICALILSVNISFAAESITVEVSDEAGLIKAIDEATKDTPVTIVLKNDITLSEMITIDGNVDITLESAQGSIYSIHASEGARHFYLENAALTIQDTILDGNNKGGGIDIDGTDRNFEALLTLKEGSAIKNCYRNEASYYGGGAVSLTANSISTPWKARLVIDGGEILNNKFESTSSLATAGGGGIYANGVGVTVELKDGAITGNSSQNGGAVKLSEDAKFIMSGGEISNNSNWLNYGSGIFLMYGSSFIMNGGTIENNKQLNGYGNYYGGGVCVYENESSFTMNGGAIKNNGEFVQSAASSSGCKGGGVCVYGTANFTMENGIVSHNKATSGAGVLLTASYPSDTPTIIMKNDSSIEYNYAQYSGGGIGSLNPHGAVIEMYDDACVKYNEVNKSTDTTNSVTAYTGGGIHLSSNDEDAYIKMSDDSSVHSNIINGAYNGGYGGGIYSGVPVELNNNSTIHDNSVTTSGEALGDGGGMILLANGNTTITGNASIYSNTASGSGGGMYVSNRADLLLEENVSVTGNTAGLAGGGIYIDDDSATEDNPSVFTMTGGKISGNTALGNGTIKLGEGGGGIYIKTSGVDKSLVTFKTEGQTYITDNSAPNGHGGGIYCAEISTDDPWKMVLDLDEKTVFSRNSASVAYIPPENVFEQYTNIKFESISIADLDPYHPLNNYDINFIGDEEYVEPSPEDPVIPDDPEDPEEPVVPDDSDDFVNPVEPDDSDEEYVEPSPEDLEEPVVPNDPEDLDDSDEMKKPDNDDAVKSGDEFNLAVMLAVMMLAAAVMTTVVVRKRG